MIGRRDLLIGGACLAGAGLGYAVTPHRYKSLMGGKTCTQVTPTSFGEWTSRDASDLAPPVEQGSESAKLYDELVERVYQNGRTGAQIMMLIAHGPTQTYELMLHRPETCYPANGYTIVQSAASGLPIAPSTTLPTRRLVAETGGSHENIVYWTRLGEYLPISNSDQRTSHLMTVMHGYIGDGVLARFSIISEEAAPAITLLDGFIQSFVKAVAPADRAALIGTDRAAALRAAGI